MQPDFQTLTTPILQASELWFLFQSHAPAVILGLPDPTQGMVSEDIDQLQAHAGQSLAQQNLIALQPDGGWHVTQPLANLIQIVAAPTHSILVVTRVGTAAPLTASFHFAGGQVVALRALGAERYQLEPVVGVKAIQEFLLAPLAAHHAAGGDSPTVTLPVAMVTDIQARITAGQTADAQALLNAAGLPEPLLARLWPAFAAPNANLSLIGFWRRDQPKHTTMQGFSVLAVADDLWVLQLVGQASDQVLLTRASSAELARRVEQFLARLEMPT